jgi:hypothetical protein
MYSPTILNVCTSRGEWSAPDSLSPGKHLPRIHWTGGSDSHRTGVDANSYIWLEFIFILAHHISGTTRPLKEMYRILYTKNTSISCSRWDDKHDIKR